MDGDGHRLRYCFESECIAKWQGRNAAVTMQFEWDPKKARRNLKKHKVSFTEAATVFSDRLSITIWDPEHSEDEERNITIGLSHSHRLMMVAHTDRGNRIRIINARELTRAEREAYENEIGKK